MEKHALDVVMSWGTSPLANELLTTPKALSIGTGPTATFALPEALVDDDFDLVVPDGEGFALRIPAGASACMVERQDGLEVLVDLGVLASDAEGVRTVSLTKDSKAELRLGEFVFSVQGTPLPESSPKGTFTDWTPARYIGASFAFHAFMLILMTFSPPAASALNINMDNQRAQYIRASMDALAQEQAELEPMLDEAAGAPSSEGQPMTGDEGATGAEDETRHTGGGVAVRGHDQEQRVPLDAQTVRTAGVLGAMATALNGMQTDISSPYGAANAAGFSEESLYGPLMADNQGFGPGASGFGMIGRGRGGCPAGRTDCLAGTVGVGTLGTVSTIGASCDSETFARYERTLGREQAIAGCSGGGSYGTRVGHLGDGNHRVPHRITGGTPATRGGLSREQVRRVVHRNLSQVRFCYEQGLQQRPDLEGRVAVRFIIRGDGGVQTSMVQETTLSSSRVEQCVSGAVQRWSFPQTGELTIVTYPFQFQSQS